MRSMRLELGLHQREVPHFTGFGHRLWLETNDRGIRLDCKHLRRGICDRPTPGLIPALTAHEQKLSLFGQMII